MKKRGLIFFAALVAANGLIYGQDLLLTFDGKDTSVDSVRVENLTNGEKVIAGGNQVLRLKQIISGVEKTRIDAGQVTFSPNPMKEYSIMEFSFPVASETVISIIDLAGKEILKLNGYLDAGHHSYRLSGIKAGINFVLVKSGGNTFAGTLVSISTEGNAKAEYINAVSIKEPGNAMPDLKKNEPEKRGSFYEVSMQYMYGDSLKFTAFSGNYRTVVFDVPDMSKTMTFDFFACTDGDNNSYGSVKIGNFIWMTENLRATTFNDGTPIRYEKDDITWAALDDKCIPAFSWYNNDEENKNVYGGLYNSAVVSVESGKNVCPDGWHVAGGEWDDLFSYLDSAAVPDGEVSTTAGTLIKESGNMHWTCPDNKATNETGFTALAGGFRNPGFSNLGERAYFWDGSDGKFILYCNSGVVGHLSENYDYGLSVRCVKDKELDISFSASGAAGTVTDVKVENLFTGATIELKGNQVLHLGHEAGPAGTVFMNYLPGQNLKFTGISGKYSTVMVEKPIENKTITFNFIPCTDGDGNNYPVVKIGDQVWMAENLKTTKYRDGTPIPYIDYPVIGGLVCEGDPGYSWYDDDANNKNIYGGLYTLKTLRTKKLCPVGWHVMAHAEMDSLISYLGAGANYQAGYGGRSDDGGKLKETGTTHWKSPNGDATNETGFTALPGGIREEDGTFRWIGEYATFMSFNVCDGSSCDGCMYTFSYASGEIHGDEYRGTTSTSVRCIFGGGPQILSTWIDSASVDLTSAIAGGEIDEFEIVTERGLCWSTYSWSTTDSNNSPSINDSHIIAGTGTGRFSAKITGLEAGALYWVRAYAKNETGITYADPVSFTTSVKDTDGNVYRTELLDQGIQGHQIWMKSNLRTVKLNDNTMIPELRSAMDWSNSHEPAYCSYDNAGNENGLLYNWYTVATGKVCPVGWKVADTIQFRINQCLNDCNPDKRTLIPAGMRDAAGEFKDKGETGYFWSMTGDENGQEAWKWSFKSGSSELSLSESDKRSGFSIRCYKDLRPVVITTAVKDLAPTSANSKWFDHY
jgi:uncharacterized protein (TIGR02145 family)